MTHKQPIQPVRCNRDTCYHVFHIMNTGYRYGSIDRTIEIIKKHTKETHIWMHCKSATTYCRVKNKLYLNENCAEC